MKNNIDCIKTPEDIDWAYFWSKKLTEKISPIINPYFMAAFNTFVCINYPLLFCHKNTKKYGESCNFLVTTTV